MTRINTNVSTLNALRNLSQSNKMLGRSLDRLSSGFRINRAADDPAGLVISEQLRRQIAGLRQAVENSERARNMVATAEGALNEVNALLIGVQDLIIEAANTGGLSDDEIQANQDQVDSAIESINRIANTASFAGIKLLNGVSDYTTSQVNNRIIDLSVFGANMQGVSNITVTLKATTSAEFAHVQQTTSASGLGTTNVTLQISGNKGTTVLSFANSTANSAIAAAVIAVKENTGVSAVVSGTTGMDLVFMSTEYGEDQFVSVKEINNETGTLYIDARDEGVDMIMSINGSKAATDGNTATINTEQLSLELTVSADFVSGSLLGSTTFQITGGGLTFQLGADTAPNEQEQLGIQRLTSDGLGRGGIGFLNQIVTGQIYDLKTDAEQAARIVKEAIADVTGVRSRLGAFEANTLETNINSLGISIENLAASESRIRDTDFALETAEFTRSQILVQAGTAILAQANLVPQSVLQLLG